MVNNLSQDDSRGGASLAVRPWVRVARLESLLRSPVQRIDWRTAEEIVRRRLPEDQSLEFKSRPYDNSSKSKHELCKDVAGMANASGGLIVVRIAEDDQNSADALAPVGATESDEVTRMHQVLLASIEPMIPGLAIWEDFSPATEGGEVRRLLFILVPDSDVGPHGVRTDDAYRWPVRHDRVTRWMREPELATAYRERFRTADDAGKHVTELHRSARSSLDEHNICWIAITCVPRLPGHLPADRESYRSWLSNEMQDLPFKLSAATAVLGRRRIVFTDQYPYTGISRDHHLELHADGSGFGAVAITLRDNLDPRQAPRLDHAVFDTDSLTYMVVSVLALLARHATNCGGGGELNIVAQVVGSYSNSALGEVSIGRVPLVATEPYTDASGVHFGPRVIPGSMPVKEPSALNLVLPMSIAYDSSHLVEGAAEIVHELIAEFGASVSEEVLACDGFVRRRAFGGALAPLIGWARVRGLLIE